MRVESKASPGLTARSLGNLNDGPLRAVVAAWGNSGRSGMVASESLGGVERQFLHLGQIVV